MFVSIAAPARKAAAGRARLKREVPGARINAAPEDLIAAANAGTSCAKVPGAASWVKATIFMMKTP